MQGINFFSGDTAGFNTRRLNANRQTASALLICLILIVLMSILVVGFLITARLDMSASHQYIVSTEADRMAQMATNIAMARVRGATPASHYWTSMPGKIISRRITDTAEDPEEIDLSSGDATGLDDDEGVNLNIAELTSPQGTITGEPLASLTEFRLRWVYLHQDRTFSQSIPTYDPDNPVIGRYAFWTDDASARINWNTAHMKSSSPEIGNPSRIDLTAISGIAPSEANAITLFRQANGFFNSPQSVSAVGGIASFPELPSRQRFAFTHYNSSPALNPFNEPKIVLTTKAALAGGSDAFFNITTADNDDPGELSRLDKDKVAVLYKKIYDYLTRGDWPVLPGSSFQQKYGDPGAKQLVLSIIEYVRSAESNRAYIEPLRPQMAADGTITDLVGGFEYMASTRHPIITEMGVELGPAKTGTPAAYQGFLYVEVYLPPSATDPVNLKGLYLYYRDFTFPGNNYTSSDVPITSSMIIGGDELPPGGYRIIAVPIAIQTASYPSLLFLRTAISRGSPRVRLDIAPLSNTGYAQYVPDPLAVGMSAITSVAVRDPFVNKSAANWVQGANTFGSAPSLGTADSSIVPPQDTSEVGGSAIDPVSVHLGTPGPGHTIRSLGELGHIHSGSSGAAAVGVPWRTLRFQPHGNAASMLPDWALCELFTPPLATVNAVVRPEEGLLGGRVNLNAAIYPFADPDDVAGTLRPLPLLAVLQGSPDPTGGVISTTKAETLAENIRKQALVPTYGYRYGEDVYGTTGALVMPGAVAEIQGIADEGEASEATFGDFIGLVATRSSSFQVYSIGQSVRQSASGKINVLAESRTLTLFERTASGEMEVRYQQQVGQ